MFCRRWSGLPADPDFPADLAGLGFVPSLSEPFNHQTKLTASPYSYFINSDDEIRWIQCPDYYFKYFLTKNERHNERQRFAMNSPSPFSLLPTNPQPTRN